MELVRLPSLLPLLALFSAEECRVGVVRRLLEQLTTVEEVVEDASSGQISCRYTPDRPDTSRSTSKPATGGT